MQQVVFKPIGIIHTPFPTPVNMPIQNTGGTRIRATIEVFQHFVDGLMDLAGFSHIILLYHLHLVQEFSLIVKPFMEDTPHGIFATRSPVRPNPIGMTTVKLIEINNNILIIENVDIVDGTPLLDIKPYLPVIDQVSEPRFGWLSGKMEHFSRIKSDDRFAIKAAPSKEQD